MGDGHPFEPSFGEPAVYAQIAVSAADDKIHTKDDPKWNDSDRYGNESRLSPSATVFRVLQKKPDPPELVEKFGRIFATPADYHSRSYFTFRFVPKEHLKVHILRALDESLFRQDELIRETRTALDPTVPAHLDFFPDDQPPWDLPTKQEAATAVNALGTGAPYSGLTEKAWVVLALLPGNEVQPDRTALEARDTLVRHTRTALAATDVEWFPSSWNEATRTLVAENLNKLTRPDDYLKLSDEALRVLATLPGNEAAFTQVTLAPLDMADPTLHDERRPDDEPLYAPDPIHRRAYTDTLPGRATNRYFYRARFVDGAQNQSSLSGPTAPVYLPKVEPPRAPVITAAAGGDGAINLKWAHNREGDLLEYRVYRADTEAGAADTRSMPLVDTIPRSQVDPAIPAVEWADGGPLIAGREYFYRLTAVDEIGQESPATRPCVVIAVDTRVPEPPAWTEQTWLIRRDPGGVLSDWPADGVVPSGHRAVLKLGWQTDVPAPWFVLSRRRRGEPLWIEAASGDEQAFATATADEFTWLDAAADPANPGAYRLRVRSSAGVWSTRLVDMNISPPEAG